MDYLTAVSELCTIVWLIPSFIGQTALGHRRLFARILCGASMIS
jgi:hypothetical protein